MSFNIIHHRGMVREATLLDGTKVFRQEEIFVPEWGAAVKCAPYTEHFIYESPDKRVGSPAHVCTCGSIAMVRGGHANGLFVCMAHEQFGNHTTSYLNLRDIDKVAGKLLDVDGKKVEIRERKRR